MKIEETTKTMLKYIVIGIAIFVVFGGVIFGLIKYNADKITATDKTYQLFSSLPDIDLKDATIDSPVVMVKVDTAQELINIAHSEGNSVIYRISDLSYATVSNSTIGYKYHPEVDFTLWWIW